MTVRLETKITIVGPHKRNQISAVIKTVNANDRPSYAFLQLPTAIMLLTLCCCCYYKRFMLLPQLLPFIFRYILTRQNQQLDSYRSGPFLKFYDFVYMPNCAPGKFGQYNKMGRLSCRIAGFYPAVNAMVHKNIRAKKSKKRRIDELCVYFAAVIAAHIYLQEATET